MTPAAPPAGYVRVTAGQCDAVVLASLEEDARIFLAEGSLYEAAARDLGARPLQGRGVAYALALPATRTRVVVRHNRHGGLFAPLTRDLFLPPTRAPREMAIAHQLRALGIDTPEVVMYGVTPSAFVLQRADVVTREIMNGRDLSAYMMPETSERERTEAWAATRALVTRMNAVGARHHDLNVKNVLLAPSQMGLRAYLLDVDRVKLGESGSPEVVRGNMARLLRSARKWRTEHGALFDESELAALGSPIGPTR